MCWELNCKRSSNGYLCTFWVQSNLMFLRYFPFIFLMGPMLKMFPCVGGNFKFPIDTIRSTFSYTTTFIKWSWWCMLCQFSCYVLCRRKTSQRIRTIHTFQEKLDNIWLVLSFLECVYSFFETILCAHYFILRTHLNSFEWYKQ